MLMLHIKNIDIFIYIEKDSENTYQVISGDHDGHEGKLASGITTVEELLKVLEEHFGK